MSDYRIEAASKEEWAERALRAEAKLALRTGEADAKTTVIKELEAKLVKAVEALRELIDHTHNCEKELTEELHNADFCGESLPLTSARATLAELKGDAK